MIIGLTLAHLFLSRAMLAAEQIDVACDGCAVAILEGKYVVSHRETGIASMQLTNCELASLSFVVF